MRRLTRGARLAATAWLVTLLAGPAWADALAGKLAAYVGTALDVVELGTGRRFVRPTLVGVVTRSEAVTGLRIRPEGQAAVTTLSLSAIAKIVAGRETVHEAETTGKAFAKLRGRRASEAYDRQLEESLARMQANGIAPNTAELARALDVPLQEVEELLACELRSVTVSLQGAVRSKADPSELVDVLPSNEMPPMERAELAERSASVWMLLEKANLTPKERTVVMLRFGLDGTNEWRTLAEVARQLSCSREYCRQVVQRALRKLRRAGVESGMVEE